MPNQPICIIPARGGSKRIPRKNIADFNGEPMIAWPVKTVIEAGIFDRVIVSTDDEEIASVARNAGAEVPFLRSSELADDFATTADVLISVLEQITGYDTACCLYPTAPMIRASDLVSAIDTLNSQNADCVLSVTDYDFPPLRALAKKSDGSLAFNWPEHALTRSQDLPELLHDAGLFYMFKTQSLLTSGKLLDGKIIGIDIPRSRAVDIDTPEDFELAKILHAAGRDSN